ncbi:hypothetical protein DIPPA_05227 [Diplonema papillatum]|nr:hypothetical protein DIPPA_05227 [Diplonema papillatum]
MATPPTPILSRTSRGGVLSQTARTNSDASGASVKTVQQSPLTLPNAAAAAAAAARSSPRPLARKVRLSLAPSSRRGSAQGSSTTTATGDSGSSSSGGGTNASGASSRTVQPVAVDVTPRNQELWVQGGSPLARPSF